METREEKQRSYVAVDLKSFYASVECAERGLDALATNLVVADTRRTEKTICLAVSPSLKAHGISGRARLFEVIQAVRKINAKRRAKAPERRLVGSSSNADELSAHPELALDYVIAPPRMALYLERSTQIYEIYLRHVAPEDIHVYSIDEVFIDVTGYLRTAGMTAHEFAADVDKRQLPNRHGKVRHMRAVPSRRAAGVQGLRPRHGLDRLPARGDGRRVGRRQERQELSLRRI